MQLKTQPLPAVMREFLKSARQREVPSGQILLYEGDVPTEVFILKRGVVKVYDIDDQGNEKILHLVKSPAVIPYAFFSGLCDPLRWFYTALTDCEVYVLLARELQEATLANAELAQAFTQGFSIDVHEVFVRLSSLSKTNARDKLIAALKFLAVCHATQRQSGWWRVNFAVSHQLLADLCGITRESATAGMKELQTDKITRSPKLTVLEINKEKLITL